MRALGLVTLALGLLGLGLYLALGTAPTPSRPGLEPMPIGPSSRGEAPGRSSLEPPAPGPARTSGKAAEEAAVAPPTPSPTHATKPARRASVRLTGRIECLDPHGIPLRGQAGELVVTWGAETLTLGFRDDSFRVTITPRHDGDRLAVVGVQLQDGTACLPDVPGQILLLRDDLEPVVRVRVPPRPMLRVHSAATGEELDEVTVALAPEWTNHKLGAWSDGEPQLASFVAPSPIDLTEAAAALWVESLTQVRLRAPGHAWALVPVDLEDPVPRRVELPPEASVEVELIGGPDSNAVPIRVRCSEGVDQGKQLRLNLAGGALARRTLTGLAPGRYTFEVDTDADLGEDARSEVELAPGDNPPVRLTLDLPEPPPLLPCSIVVVRPDAWSERPPEALLGGRPAEVRRQGGGGEGRTRWLVTGSLPEGPFDLTLDTPGTRVRLVQPPGGADELEVVLPPPLEIHLSCVDANTGQPLDLEEVHHAHTGEPPLGLSMFGRAHRTGEPGSFTIQVPKGEFRVLTGIDRAPHNGPFRAERDGQLVRVELGIPYRLRVRMTTDGFPVPTAEVMRLSFEGLGYRTWTANHGDHHEVAFSRPGPYRVHHPGSDSYASTEPVRVEVPEDGSLGELELELVAKSP